MSWDSYIQQLEASGLVEMAAVCGCDAVWAQSKCFCISPHEVVLLTGNRSCCAIEGLKLGKVSCMVVKDRLDEDGELMLNGRTKCEQKLPLAIGRTKKQNVYIVAIGKEGTKPHNLNDLVNNMIDYLKGCGY